MGSWPPRECPLPLRCRREDRSVGQRQEKVYHVCMYLCVYLCMLIILLAVNYYVIQVHCFHSHFYSSEMGTRSRASFLLLQP